MGAKSSVVITAVKTMSLVFVGILGAIHLARFGAGPSFTKEALFAGSAKNPSKYAIALYSGLWAFDGWDACSVSCADRARFIQLT